MNLLPLCPTKACLNFVPTGYYECLICDAKGRWFSFDEATTVEAACYILKQHGEPMEMDREKLMHLLYLADVVALNEIGRPITGAKWYVGEHGVISPDIERLMR